MSKQFPAGSLWRNVTANHGRGEGCNFQVLNVTANKVRGKLVGHGWGSQKGSTKAILIDAFVVQYRRVK